MSARDLEAWKSYDGLVVHLVNDVAPSWTLCGISIPYPPGSRNTGLGYDVDCMTCLVRANRPSIEERMAAALGMPKEFLYGR